MTKADANPTRVIAERDPDEITAMISAMADKRTMITAAKTVPYLNTLQQGLRALQQRLAVLFGAGHGWTLSRSDFSPTVLARRGLFDGRGNFVDPWPRELVDHPFFYRKNRMASAVAAHLYGTFDAAKRQDIAALAETKGLQTAWPDDFPSWWLPGRTTLVVYTPMTGSAQ